MKKAVVFLAEGFEETEALFPVDLMRRAGIEVTLAGIGGEYIESAHHVTVRADIVPDSALIGYDCYFCPGGMPGSVNLAQSWLVNESLIRGLNDGAIISAICAAPAVVLAPLGLLAGKDATCYPGCGSYAPEIHFSEEGVIDSGSIVTAKSAGYAADLALVLISKLVSPSKAEEVRKSIYYRTDSIR